MKLEMQFSAQQYRRLREATVKATNDAIITARRDGKPIICKADNKPARLISLDTCSEQQAACWGQYMLMDFVKTYLKA